jgi:hypothetical protein
LYWLFLKNKREKEELNKDEEDPNVKLGNKVGFVDDLTATEVAMNNDQTV